MCFTSLLKASSIKVGTASIQYIFDKGSLVAWTFETIQLQWFCVESLISLMVEMVLIQPVLDGLVVFGVIF
jgi:hypothetical protein